MTPSINAPSLNDNFQETKAGALSALNNKELWFQQDVSQSGGGQLPSFPSSPSLMVSDVQLEEAGKEDLSREESSVVIPAYASWTKKHKIGRRKVTRSLSLKQVRDLQSAWHHASSIGYPINRFVTFRPSDISTQAPDQRIETWTHWRNKLAQFARDCGFEFTCLWVRESQRDTGLNEHMHVLMHVPKKLLKRFDAVVNGWTEIFDEIDVRPCTYRTTRNRKGGPSNVLTYISKNSPQAGRYLQRIVQLGGPILGKRYGLSRNLTAHARARDEVAGRLHVDLGLASISHRAGNLPAARPANDDEPANSDQRCAA